MLFCMSRGQVLPRVESAAENEFIYAILDTLDGAGQVWLAATDLVQEGVWGWATGTNLAGSVEFYDAQAGPIAGAFNDWGPGQPDDNANAVSGQDCGVMWEASSGWQWDDLACETPLDRVVCEDP